MIDPDKVYLGDRVITSKESPDKKTLDLVGADKRIVVNCGLITRAACCRSPSRYISDQNLTQKRS
ncbi:unnamed protein product [Arabidopsis halleri]